MPATCWDMLIRTGFKSRWGWISVAVPAAVVYLAMLKVSDWLEWTDTIDHNRIWHEALSMSAIGWGTDCIQFKQSHKPLKSIAESDSIINSNFLLYMYQNPIHTRWCYLLWAIMYSSWTTMCKYSCAIHLIILYTVSFTFSTSVRVFN